MCVCFFYEQKDSLQHLQSESDAPFVLHDAQIIGDIKKGAVSVGGGVCVCVCLCGCGVLPPLMHDEARTLLATHITGLTSSWIIQCSQLN